MKVTNTSINVKELRIGNLVVYPKHWGDKPIRVTGTDVVDRRDNETGIYEEFLYLSEHDFLEEGCFETFVSYKQGVIGEKDLLPIVLTEDWLIKFGFEKQSNNWTKLCILSCVIYLYWERLAGVSLLVEGQTVSLPNIKYVHQLQNLFFALTGEELEIQDNLK